MADKFRRSSRRCPPVPATWSNFAPRRLTLHFWCASIPDNFRCKASRAADQGKETILHTFTGTSGDGAQPYGGVILDSSGNLYGAAPLGGANGQGIIFKLDSHGKETILYTFTGGADGGSPIGTLVTDDHGNFYGTAATGGASGVGTVFKIDAASKYMVLYTFTGGTDGGFPESPLVLDPAGNLYGTTDFGGASGFGNVFKVDAKGTETVLYSFTGGADGGSPTYAGLVRDAAGNLYGAVPSGGTKSDFGVVFKIDTTGKETVLHRFKGTDGRIPDGSLALDSHGNLYGTTTLGGAYNGGVIYKISR
jgi:uncharacterized repeat protein (TIGR03803 family)